jgi:hypothetical protein
LNPGQNTPRTLLASKHQFHIYNPAGLLVVVFTFAHVLVRAFFSLSEKGQKDPAYACNLFKNKAALFA